MNVNLRVRARRKVLESMGRALEAKRTFAYDGAVSVAEKLERAAALLQEADDEIAASMSSGERIG